MEDIVISSYKQQIKETILKAEAVKEAGFDIVIDELEKREINTTKIKEFFNKIVNSHTMEDLNKLTLDDLYTVIDDIKLQVTRALIAKVEIADAVVRKAKLVALSKSVDGKIKDDDNYVKVGNNLSTEINKDGIASGLEVCIRNYCNQKIYLANYREKMIEKEKELGIYDEESKAINRSKINEKMGTVSDNKKQLLLKKILNKDVSETSDIDFYQAKEQYHAAINERMKHLQEYR